MEQSLSLLATTHLLQHTLRSLCVHHSSQWVYAVFWRILPRNYPPPKWENQGAFDRSRGNWRNWILVWEDGFCNFAASEAAGDFPAPSVVYGVQPCRGLQPELFFKMSHEIYNYGEGLIGKVAADRSHKWIHNEPNDNQDIKFLPTWQNSADSHPRTWEAQFQSGIKTIALIAVKEGVVQLGAVQKVTEDLSFIVQLRKKLCYIESIPGVLLPHPLCSSIPSFPDVGASTATAYESPEMGWFQGSGLGGPVENLMYNNFNQQLRITPSMSSLEALLAKLPSVVAPAGEEVVVRPHQHQSESSAQRTLELLAMEKVAKVENHDDDDDNDDDQVVYSQLLRRYHDCDITTTSHNHGV
ncbi:protein RICE SALT SENSITIVE 3-like [Cucurbita pepo subsp. pepo]|uniref:protein RICE SALT SENSITIVE 3-like n=1 Tax=Cucurbita pepo subsp. pepo TaxID=3664 RepID=UPI000C9DA1CC|nr:protein RICE SALT SENSITIVE 3-like [Cucurbita pepo subsp. pepo]